MHLSFGDFDSLHRCLYKPRRAANAYGCLFVQLTQQQPSQGLDGHLWSVTECVKRKEKAGLTVLRYSRMYF